MRTILAAAACLLICLSATAGSVQVSSLATNAVQGATTNTVTALIGAEGAGTTIPVQVSFNLSAAGTDDQRLVFKTSMDGNYWLAGQTVIIAGNGTNTVNTVTNITTAGLPLIKIDTWGNTAGSAYATNLSVKYYVP